MKKYVKKPVVINAIELEDNVEEVLSILNSEVADTAYSDGKDIIIVTLEGEMRASAGDFIIKGVRGEYYPCKPDIFKETYSLVE